MGRDHAQSGRPRTIGRRASRRARDKCARRTARVVVAVAGDVSRRRSSTSPFTLFPQPTPELDAPRERGFRRLERNGWRNVCEVRGSGAVCRFDETKPVLRCKSSGRYRVSRAGFQPDRGAAQRQFDISSARRLMFSRRASSSAAILSRAYGRLSFLSGSSDPQGRCDRASGLNPISE